MLRKIFLLLPAYNPGKKVIQVVSQALPLVDEIVIVDDGCDEAERAYLHKSSVSDKVTLLKHHANIGKGVALHTGINHCLSKMCEGDFILTMDSDGQHDPADISKFRELLNQEGDLHFAFARFISAVFNFSGHKRFSFRSKRRLVRAAMKYFLAVTTALALATFLLYLCVAGLDIPEYLAKPLVDTAVFVINFVVLSRLVFRDRAGA